MISLSKHGPLFARKFSLLTLGEATSMLGDQLTRIALIWLILQMTGSPAAVGIWLALGAIPRAIFLLLGGALVDRYSPPTMIIASNLIRVVLVVILAITAATNAITFVGLCVFTVLFGAAGALYAPSLPAILPRLLPAKLLQSGNSVIHGIMHVANLLGPPLAAFILASLLGEVNALPASGIDQQPYALLFALDAATFLVSLWTMILIGRLPEPSSSQRSRKNRVLADIINGIRFVINRPHLRIFVFVTLLANFGIGGPLAVALPLLAKFALSQGVIALGMLSAAAATGSLVGLAAAAILPQQNAKRMFLMPFVFLPVLGLLMVTLGWAESIERAAVTLGTMTTLAVYLDIQVLTWLQQTTNQNYLGRVMSILQLGAFGIMPVSMAIAGFLGANLTLMFVSFGGVVIAGTMVIGVSARGYLQFVEMADKR